MTAFHELKMNSLSGTPVPFANFKGKTCLVVNVASRCGLTPQYAGLRKLQADNAAKNFTVLGFPCNQFGAQEPGSPEEIQAFCDTNYDVNFPLFEKIEVNGPGTCALYELLKSKQVGEDGKADILWNFTKFLVDRDGNVVARFGPRTTPEEIAKELPKYL